MGVTSNSNQAVQKMAKKIPRKKRGRSHLTSEASLLRSVSQSTQCRGTQKSFHVASLRVSSIGLFLFLSEGWPLSLVASKEPRPRRPRSVLRFMHRVPQHHFNCHHSPSSPLWYPSHGFHKKCFGQLQWTASLFCKFARKSLPVPAFFWEGKSGGQSM